MKLDFDPRKNITVFDNTVMPLKRVKDFLVIHRIVKNWQDIFLFRVGLKKPGFVMQLRNGKSININNQEDYFSFWETGVVDRLIEIKEKNNLIEFKFNGKVLRLYYDSQKQLSNTVSMVKDQFIEQQYSWLDVKNKNVIDIGANIGDSAIYFALKGAKRVYAFEPYIYSYKIATKNIKLNRLQQRITLLNEGCSEKDESIKIDSRYKNFGGTDLKMFEKGKEIRITTLGEIIKRFNISYNSVLKIDCEGCEYGVLLGSKNSDLRKFEQIQIEYHYGYLNLKRKLEEAGFRVSKTLPKSILNLKAENREMLIGLLYAERAKHV